MLFVFVRERSLEIVIEEELDNVDDSEIVTFNDERATPRFVSLMVCDCVIV